MADVVGDGVLEVSAEFKRDSAGRLRDQFGRYAGEAGEAGGGKASKSFGSSFTAAIGKLGLGVALGNLFTSAMSRVSSAIGDAIARVDTLNNFPRVMENMGFSADEAAGSIQTISDRLQGLPTTLDSMASTVQRLAQSTGSLDGATDIALAFNNALLAGGAPIANQSAALEQYAQGVSKGKFEMMEWRSLLVAMPGQLGQVATSLLGATASTDDLYNALGDGTLSIEDFNAAIVALDKEGVAGFASFEEQARGATGGIGTQLKNLETAVTRGLAKIIDPLAPMIGAAVGAITPIFDNIASAIVQFMDYVGPGLAELGPMIADTFGPVADAIGSFLQEADLLIPVMSGVAAVIGGALTYAVWAFTAALLANPVTWVVVGIVALVAAIVWLVQNWDMVTAAITDIWGGFIGWITGVIDGFVGWWNGIWGAVGDFFTSIWQGIVSFVMTVLTEFGNFWRDIWQGIVDFLTPVFEVVGTIIRVAIETWVNIFIIFAAVLKTIWDAIVLAATWVWGQIVGFITPIIDGIVSFVTTAFTEMSNFLRDIWQGIVDFVTPIVEAIALTIDTTISALKLGWETVWGAISSFFIDTWNNIINFIAPIVQTIYNAIVPKVQAVKSAWDSTWGAIRSFFVDTWNNITNAVRAAVDTVIRTVSGIYDRVMGALRGAGRWLYNVGRDVIEGLINGISSMFNSVVKAITGVVDGAIDWAKNVLGINSPSRVFAEIGHDTMAGYIKGIEDMQSPLDRAFSDVIGHAVAPFNAGVSITPSASSTIGADALSMGRPSIAAADSASTPGADRVVFEAGAFMLSGADPRRTAIEVADEIAEMVNL